MLRLVRDKVFPHFNGVVLNGGAMDEYMKDAQLMIQKWISLSYRYFLFENTV
jgi:hypothetical protein